MKLAMLSLHPFACPPAADVDIAIVGIPYEAELAPLQFPVEFVEHEMRPQRR
jgi:hypothetical protein